MTFRMQGICMKATMRKVCAMLTLVVGVLLCGCVGNNARTDNLQEKIDSIHRIEQMELLRMQGVNLGDYDDNPLRVYYDSLEKEGLPLRYTRDFFDFACIFKPLPRAIAQFYRVGNMEQPYAVSLPERGNVHPMLIANFDEGQLAEIWLYTLGNDYLPIDNICLYDMADSEEDSYFAITSGYEVYRDRILYVIDEEGVIREGIGSDMEHEEY